ncbi:DUF5701 family protein [Cellulomonas sp. URHD0024]|uniref:DUF5701 family protein n=1 Tax=Cellulomonas sp. URHD0024 TaxID=1302620 RepID=UPI0003FB8D2E|nr:DUF5701 family protein [Cellulomonas sp. URHD0024]
MGVPVTFVDPSLPTVAAPPSAAAGSFDPETGFADELHRQVTAYVELGIPALLGLDASEFHARLAPPASASLTPAPQSAVDGDAVPFVLVVPGLDVNDLAPAMRRGAKLGVSVIDRVEAPTYQPIVDVPTEPYLLWGIDTGSEFCNVTPETALATLTARRRTPLTIDEGVALTVVRPDMLRPNKCYSLMGSRTGTNQRVPAVWISERRAKLGWCWDRNPHTWLGAASASGRRPL